VLLQQVEEVVRELAEGGLGLRGWEGHLGGGEAAGVDRANQPQLYRPWLGFRFQMSEDEVIGR
jgi:hypothetical protein